MGRKARATASTTGTGGLPPGTAFGADAPATAHFHAGNQLAQTGRLTDAVAQYRRAIAANPVYAHALSNLGNVLAMLNRQEEAIGAWRRAVAADPDYAVPRSNLGLALTERGQLDEAIAHLRRAVELKPDFVGALDNLARALLTAGHASEALQAARRAIALKPTAQSKKVFVDCLRHITFPADDSDLRSTVLRALQESWARPDRLIGPAAALARRNPALAACVEAAVAAWPMRLADGALWTREQRAVICGDPLLRALLETAPICDLELERFLTAVRSALLARTTAARPADETELAFSCALARQCFINEYIFAVSPGEIEFVDRLTQSLATTLARGDDVPPLWFAVIGCYRPLHGLPQAAAFMERESPPAARALLVQQVQEPLAEIADKAMIPALTAIADSVSCAVREQYEENPYPRWIELAPSTPFDRFESYLSGLLPWSNIRPEHEKQSCDILIAGCGTGLHAIEAARRSQDARVLAIDLSRTSLAYAQRKARALNLSNIDFAQADILQAASIGRSFDVIESGGVLHHLEHPTAGWRALLTLLRPGGYMFIGLYSEAARAAVVAAREFIAARGYRPNADGIRAFRQDVVSAGLPLGNLLTSPDFFNASGCRDLFFHAQEHRVSLPEIAAFLRDNRLKFLGFNLDAQALQQFRRRHPAPQAMTDLEAWHGFEMEHPRTFSAMYQFWVQKPR